MIGQNESVMDEEMFEDALFDAKFNAEPINKQEEEYRRFWEHVADCGGKEMYFNQ